MKKYNSIQEIKVGSNCSEVWEEMDLKGRNRHCQSCNKTVHDFSQATDKEIIAFFKKRSHQKTCGKFNGTQLENLNRTLAPPPTNHLSNVLKPMMVAATITSAVACSSSKHSSDSPSCTTSGPAIEIIKNHIHPDSVNTTLITGNIMDDLGEPLIGASLIVHSTTIGTATDFDGTFRLEIPNEKIIEEQVLISYTGFAALTVSIKEYKNKELKVRLEEDVGLLGEVVIIRSPWYKRLWWKIKGIFG